MACLLSFRVKWAVKDYPTLDNQEDYYAKNEEHARCAAFADFARIFPKLVIDYDSVTVEQLS